MNSLSLLLYFIDVLYSLNVVMVIGALAIIIYTLGRFAYWASMTEWSSDTPEQKESKRNFKVITTKWLIGLPVVLLLIASLIPTKETMYMIAASEVGGYVANTKEAKEILQEVTNTIKSELKGLQND